MERAAIASHSTATDTGSWDGPANEARLPNDDGEAAYRKAYAWQDPQGDPDAKSSYKFIHHEVSGDGTVGAANCMACSSGIAVLNGGRGGTTIPAGDRQGIYNHLARHLKDAGMTPPEMRSETLDPTGRACERTFLLEDIAIRGGGDGRTVTAYAAVFNTPAEITDQDGHYLETISPGAFDKTIAENAGRIQVFYNHGKTLYGTPSERASLPLGTPEEIRADERGLFTVTRYNRTPLADEVLESIRNGDIKGQSFGGRFIPGKSQRTRGRANELDTIVRNEVALREYGPTPMPSYKEAAIVGVRAEELAAVIDGLDDDQRAELIRILSTRHGEPLPDTGAAPRTPVSDDMPAQSHLSGPKPSERRLYVARFRKAS